MYLVAIGWLYVAVMMAVAEATASTGTMLGAIFTFLGYGVVPVALVIYIMGTPARKKAIRERERIEHEAHQARSSGQPDAGGETSAAPVAPVRKEP